MVNIRPLSAALQKTAIEELNEVPERIPDDIEALRTWINQQPHLKARTDDQFLLSFLRGCKYSLEKAKSKIDKYYTLKSRYPEFFTVNDLQDSKTREIIRLGVGVVLPKPLNENGPRICIVRNGHYPIEKFTFQDIIRVSHAVNDILMLEDDYALINGLVYIMDFSEVTAQHFLQFTPSIMKKMSTFSEEAMPLRPKAQHVLNTPLGFDQVFNTLKPFIPKKQQDRMFFHGNKWEKLYEHVPQKYLPKEYGGENGSLEELILEWENKLDSYEDYFKENSKYGTVESLRPGKPIDFDNIFGIDGSFRKLNID